MPALLVFPAPELAFRYCRLAGSLCPVLLEEQRLATSRRLAVFLRTGSAPDHWKTGVHQVLLNVHGQSDARKRSPSA